MFFLVPDFSHSLVIWLVMVVNSIFSPCQPAQSDLLTAQVVLWLLEWTLHGNMVPVQISYLSREIILWKPSENIREISEALENLLSCCHSYPEKEIDPPWGWGWRLWDVAAQRATATGAELVDSSLLEAATQVHYTRMKIIIVPPWDFC